MYQVSLEFELTGKRNDENATGAIYSYLSACRNNGQVICDEWPVTFSKSRYSVSVLLAERDSLSRKNCNKYVLKSISELKKSDLKRPIVNVIGRDVNSFSTGEIDSNEWFILFTNYLSMDSPIMGGDDFKPIPLYKFPKTCNDEYYDILCWKSDYAHCDSLQMGCATGERFGTREMSRIDSSLSKRGLEICDKLTESVGKPFYYYLFKYYGRSFKKETERACPLCGNKQWMLKEPLFHFWDFKCDKCRLLSTIAMDVR